MTDVRLGPVHDEDMDDLLYLVQRLYDSVPGVERSSWYAYENKA